MEYVRVVEDFSCPADTVWREIADFGGIARWVQGVSACMMEGVGVGAVRTVLIGQSRQVRERLTTLDTASRRLGYEVMPPHTLPARDVRSMLDVIDLAPGQARITWRSQATFDGNDSGAMADAIGKFYRASLQNLRALLDTAA